jgi:hypothetical protein
MKTVPAPSLFPRRGCPRAKPFPAKAVSTGWREAVRRVSYPANRLYILLLPKYSVKTAQFCRLNLRKHRKTPNVRLKTDPWGAPLPWPLFAGIQRQDKKPVSPSAGAVSRRKPVQRAAGQGKSGGKRVFSAVFPARWLSPPGGPSRGRAFGICPPASPSAARSPTQSPRPVPPAEISSFLMAGGILSQCRAVCCPNTEKDPFLMLRGPSSNAE